MPIDALVRAAHEFLDAEVMLEQRRTEEGDTTRAHHELERAKRQLSDELRDGSNVPSERSLVVEGEAYLAAATAFEAARNSPVAGVDLAGPARRLERAQQGLQGMLGRYAREAFGREADRVVHAKRVLVGVDGSRPSEWAVDTAGRLAVDLGAIVQLLHVRPARMDLDPIPVPPAIDENEVDRQEGEASLRAGRARLPPTLPCTVVQRWGDAPVEIVNVARRWGADFIVLGTRGRGRLSRFVLGSTAEAVIRLAACPVITVAHEPPAVA